MCTFETQWILARHTKQCLNMNCNLWSATIVGWCSYLYQACVHWWLMKPRSVPEIITMRELKKKVFGIIKWESRDCYLATIKSWDCATHLPIIRGHILPGTNLIRDYWYAYSCLQLEGYHRRPTVNYIMNYVNLGCEPTHIIFNVCGMTCKVQFHGSDTGSIMSESEWSKLLYFLHLANFFSTGIRLLYSLFQCLMLPWVTHAALSTRLVFPSHPWSLSLNICPRCWFHLLLNSCTLAHAGTTPCRTLISSFDKLYIVINVSKSCLKAWKERWEHGQGGGGIRVRRVSMLNNNKNLEIFDGCSLICSDFYWYNNQPGGAKGLL